MRPSNFFLIGALLLIVAVPIVLANVSEMNQGEATNQTIRDCRASSFCHPAPGQDVDAVLANNEAVIARDRVFIGAGVAMGAAGIACLTAGGILMARAKPPQAMPPLSSAPLYRRHQCGALIGMADNFCTICGKPAALVAPQPAPAAAPQDEAIHHLRVRLARGEISLAEYEQLRVVLEA